jgi:hypothetical protein
MIWQVTQPGFEEQTLGLIPSFFDEADPRPAAEQLHANYIGGAHPLQNASLTQTAEPGRLGLSFGARSFRVFEEVARAQLRDEEIIVFETAWLAIRQIDGTFAVFNVN